MAKITKQQLAIKLLFWLLPWPLSRPLPRILRQLHYGPPAEPPKGYTTVVLDPATDSLTHIQENLADAITQATDLNLAPRFLSDLNSLYQALLDYLKSLSELKPILANVDQYTDPEISAAIQNALDLHSTFFDLATALPIPAQYFYLIGEPVLTDLIASIQDILSPISDIPDALATYQALLDYLKSLSDLKAILANVDQYTDPQISAAIQNALDLHSTFFDLATALAIPAQYFYLIGEPVLTDLIESTQDILSLISDIPAALAAALQALLDALHVVEDFQDYNDQYSDPPPETHDPFGIIPHLSPGPAPALPSSSKPTSKKWRWRDLTDSCCWSEGDSCSWDDVLRRWTFTNHGGNLYRKTSWTQSWRPTHYRITHTFNLIAFEILDTSYNTLENIYDYASGSIRPITWFSNDLWYFSFYAPPPGDISKIEFYSLRITC